MASIIFYGVGQNARDNYDRWINHGLKPVCFADGDVRKQFSFYKGLEILPLFEAISRYPDYEIYCTQAAHNLNEIYNYLVGVGIPKDKIKYCEKEIVIKEEINFEIL